MEIIEYSEEWKEKWDQFVISSSNGTMFHMQKFFDYHTPGKFAFNHLVFLEKNQIVAVLPGSIIDGKLFESPIGASYGSIVIGDITFKKTHEIVITLIEYGKKKNWKKRLLRKDRCILRSSSLFGTKRPLPFGGDGLWSPSRST